MQEPTEKKNSITVAVSVRDGPTEPRSPRLFMDISMHTCCRLITLLCDTQAYVHVYTFKPLHGVMQTWSSTHPLTNLGMPKVLVKAKLPQVLSHCVYLSRGTHGCVVVPYSNRGHMLTSVFSPVVKITYYYHWVGGLIKHTDSK